MHQTSFSFNLSNIEQLISLHPPEVTTFSFQAIGIPCQCLIKTEGAERQMVILAELGNVPFSAESPEKRQNLIEILQYIRIHNHRVRFGINHRNRLFIAYRVPVAHNPSVERLVAHSAMMIMEALPYLAVFLQFVPSTVQVVAKTSANAV